MSTIKIKVHHKDASGEWRDSFIAESFDSENKTQMNKLKELLFELALEGTHSGVTFCLRETTGASCGSKLSALLNSSQDEPEEKSKTTRRSRSK